MKHGETLLLEIKVSDDGAIRARRKDRKPLTDEDRAEARRVADSLPGITADDVFRIFPGAEILPKTPEAERWLEAQGVSEADRQAISEDAARWADVELARPERFWVKRIVTRWDIGNPRAPHSSRKEDDGTWGEIII
jgi:hypothetical protein